MIGDLWNTLLRVLRNEKSGRTIGYRKVGRNLISPRFEPLEDRRLLAVSHIAYDAINSHVNITGTSDADSVLVSTTLPGTIQVRFESTDGVETADFLSASV